MAVDNPELIDAYLELDHALNLKNYEIALDMGVDIIRRNGFYETTDFFSPALLSRFLARRLNEEAVREAVRDTFAIFGKTGLIIAACSSAKAPFPWENTLAMVHEWKKLR